MKQLAQLSLSSNKFYLERPRRKVGAFGIPQLKNFHYFLCRLFRVPSELHYSLMGNWKPIWIASLEISERIREKIHAKHHVDSDELLVHLICNPRVQGRLIYNLEHGQGYLIYIQVRPGKIFEVHANLIQSDYSAWSLRSARIIAKIPE